MSEYTKKLHILKNGVVEDITLYTTKAETSTPALCIQDGANTVYAKLGDVSDMNASSLRVSYGGATYSVFKVASRTPTITTNKSSVSVPPTLTEQFSISTDSDGQITVTSSNPSVATVAINGNTVTVSGVAFGNATITISTAATSAYKAGTKTLPVVVEKREQTITLSKSYLYMLPLDSDTVTVTTDGGGTLSVVSSNTNTATVSLSGSTLTVQSKAVNGDSVNSATITVSATETATYKAGTATIGVSVRKEQQTITVGKTQFSFTKGGVTDTTTVTASGGGTLSAVSSNTNVATTGVSGGSLWVTSNKHGGTNITITAAETSQYKAATKTIGARVEKPYATMTLSKSSVRLSDTLGWSDYVGITTDYDGYIVITSNYPNVADATGGGNSGFTVQAYGNGFATLTVKGVSGDGTTETTNYRGVYQKTCNVTVSGWL